MLCTLPLVGTRAQSPTNPATFSGSYDPHVYPCNTPRHHFNVGTGQTRLVVQASAAVPTNDISVTLLYGPDPAPVFVQTEDTGTSSEALIYQPPAGVPPGVYQVQICQTPNTNGVPQMAPYTYNGIFTQDNTANPVAGATPPPYGPIPPAPQDTGPKIGFENFAAPGVLVPVKTTEAGQQLNSVEYMGRNAGEPSIGHNWVTDTAVFYSGLETLFIKFNDTCPTNGLSSTWVNRAAPTQIAVDSDPIGFTDSPLGRSFTGELTLLTPTCKTSFTNDDGLTWIPTQGSGLLSGVDHETIGGGVYHAPLNLNPPSPAYPHAVYYCSQEGEDNTGLCSRSDDGGLTFGPSVPVTLGGSTCSGLHGHVKVSPKDGTVYLPFNSCDGVGGLAVSFDNGVTWTVRHVASATVSTQPSASFQDPAVAVDTTGRVYYIISNGDKDAAVATSDDYGATWQNLSEVSSVYGIQNVRYPAATAGDAGRAAVSFYGTITPSTPVGADDPNFRGVWHLFVASTFDGGAHWTITDATPNAPMQRGCIWAHGGANICRNLLDFFDMTVDKFGRVEVGYVNGCEGGNCVQAPIVSGQTPVGQGNAYTSAATIARQSGGRRLFFASDPASPTSKPGMPLLTQRRLGNVVYLQWSEADAGNLIINNYRILRGTTSNGETLRATVAGTQTGGTYTDVLPANDTTTYYYKVIAVNSAGQSCGNNEVAAPYLGTTCSGIVIHRNDPTHPEANAGTATPASLLIDYIAVAEPPNTGSFVFKMKVNDLSTLPPSSRWRIVWNSYAAQAVANDDAGQQFYAGMRTDQNGAVSFEYGALADAGIPAVFVISEVTSTPATGSGYQPDGTITIVVPKSAVGNPAPGTLLGGVNGRTFTGDTQETRTLHRSNAFIDHTFVKAQTDNSYPASTYLVAGNTACTPIAPVGAVSRKIHSTAGTFDINLPLTGPRGVECRNRGATGAAGVDHKLIFTFANPVASCGTASTGSVTSGPNPNQCTVNLTGVSDVQYVTVTLTGVADTAGHSGTPSVTMGVLAGDVTGDRVVDSKDQKYINSKSGQKASSTNFRADVTVDGLIDGNDASFVGNRIGHKLP